MFHLKKEQSTVTIRMTRDSVCMADDCMAPNEKKITFEPSDTLSELLNRAKTYVPAMRDCEWEVRCGEEVLGRLVSGADGKYQVKQERPDIRITALPEYEIFCRKKPKKEPLSYFERVEVLYDGQYFSATVFRDYGDVKTILEKGETKITTMDREFALSHGFRRRAGYSYDKVLPIEAFDGLRIVRIPNDEDVEIGYVVIPKEQVKAELARLAAQ